MKNLLILCYDKLIVGNDIKTCKRKKTCKQESLYNEIQGQICLIMIHQKLKRISYLLIDLRAILYNNIIFSKPLISLKA